MIQAYRIRTYTQQTKLPSESLINRHAETYLEAFNRSPWDVYGWNLSPEKAKREFRTIVSAVLGAGGVLISSEDLEYSLGFCLVTDMSIFMRRLEQVERFKRLPKKFINPRPYIETLSKIMGIPKSKFAKIGYIALLAVSMSFSGRGYGMALLEKSIEYLKASGKEYALAWSINPTVASMFKKIGFEHINGIGNKGEGIDFLVQWGIWYPTLDFPTYRGTTAERNSAVAEHYLKKV